MKKLYILVLIISLSQFISAQEKEKVIATAGKEKISANEYRTRYELMPHISKNQDLIDSLKYEFLYSLVAEKLWAQEAARLGMDTTEIIKYSMKSIEKLYVKDALYKQEVENKIKISGEELIKGTFRTGFKLSANIISSGDSSEIFNIYAALKKGASFDSLLHTRPEYKDQELPLAITYGQMEDERIEDSLYAMKVGNISQPLRTENGWFIFKLKNKEEVVFNNKKADETTKKARDIIKQRKAKKLEAAFLNEFMPKAEVTTSGPLFWNVVGKSAALLIEKAKRPEFKKSNVNLDERDVSKMISQFGRDSLNMALIHFKDKSVSLRDFLYSFVTDGFTVKEPTYEKVVGKLRTYLNDYISQEILSREGYRRGLQNMPEVKSDMKLWKENYISQILRNQFLDSAKVSDEEVQEYYNKLNSGAPVPEVNIIEIFTKDLGDIETILNELKSGKDFRDLAKIYNKREATKNKGGEYGFFPINMYGELGKTAAKMKVGEVYGPMQLGNGYSIFKLIDRKEKRDSLSKPFEELKDQYKDDLFNKKLTDAFDGYTVKLAQKYGVKINDGALKNLNVTTIQMFTSRYLGFGGRIAAVPYTAPWFEWFKQFKKMKNYNP
ncbi:MAG TPA: peptidyl-prolyl cis-trans isomerase [Ignavibacteriales bacterium]|nr:peptidyl-prolyl cis-trans isomerase [Ignavibacteriales bacterium]